MIDREKVIKGLGEISDSFFDMYINETGNYTYKKYCDVAENAIALLKEQEPVEPKTEQSSMGYWYICGACGWWLFEVRDTVHFENRKRVRFCASCGRSVKWND